MVFSCVTVGSQSLPIKVGYFGILISPAWWKVSYFSEKRHNLSESVSTKKRVRRIFFLRTTESRLHRHAFAFTVARNGYRKLRRILCSSEVEGLCLQNRGVSSGFHSNSFPSARRRRSRSYGEQLLLFARAMERIPGRLRGRKGARAWVGTWHHAAGVARDAPWARCPCHVSRAVALSAQP